MNTEFRVDNDKVIVSDKNGVLRELPNYANTEEILELENLIEELKRRIHFTNYMRDCNKPQKPKIFRTFVLDVILISIPFIIALILKVFYNIDPPTFNIGLTSLYKLPISIAISAGVIGVIDAISLFRLHRKNKDILRIRRSYEVCIEYLNEQLKEAEQKLARLNKENSMNTSNNYNTKNNGEIKKINIENMDLFKQIVEQERFYESAGYNLDKYYRHYLDGTLQFVLDKKGEVNKLDKYIDFIEEKGPTLIKDFRHSERY